MAEPINILLLVEDDDNDIVITKRKLSRSSVKINAMFVAKSLSETMKLLRDNQYIDIILLDLNLPDSQGLETLDRLRSVYDGIIVVVTSLDDESIGIDAIKRGADNYLVKNNITERLLSDSIFFAIERRRRWSTVCKVHNNLDKLESELNKKL